MKMKLLKGGKFVQRTLITKVLKMREGVLVRVNMVDLNVASCGQYTQFTLRLEILVVVPSTDFFFALLYLTLMTSDEHVNGTSTISTSSGAKVEKCSPISLVKLTRSGLLLLTFAKDISPDTVYIVSDLIQSLEAGTLKSPT